MMDIKEIDPGVRDLVLALWADGYTTTDSGDGVSKPAEARVFDVPHVSVQLEFAHDLSVETHALFEFVENFEPGEWTVQGTFGLPDGVCMILLMRDRGLNAG